MATVTDQQCVDAWKAASVALANGVSYEINGRKLTRANAAEVRSMIAFYEERIALADTSTDESGTGWILGVFN